MVVRVTRCSTSFFFFFVSIFYDERAKREAWKIVRETVSVYSYFVFSFLEKL